MQPSDAALLEIPEEPGHLHDVGPPYISYQHVDGDFFVIKLGLRLPLGNPRSGPE